MLVAVVHRFALLRPRVKLGYHLAEPYRKTRNAGQQRPSRKAAYEYLIHSRWPDRGVPLHLLQVLGLVVANTDGPDPALRVQLLEGQPELFAVFGLQRVRRVDEEQVDVPVVAGVDLPDALQRAEIGLALAEARVPDLGGDEDGLARQAAAPQRGAHLLLVLVDLRGVDVPVPGGQGAQAGCGAVGPVDLVHSEAEDGHPGFRPTERDAGC